METPTKMRDMDFPRTANHIIWEKYLKRDLLPKERFLLQQAHAENNFNEVLRTLHEKSLEKGLYISKLTKLHGNCLFESLIEHNIGESADTLRKSLSYLLYVFKDHKPFFETQDESIKDLFVFNEIEYVFCPAEDSFYKYTFEVMCQDMATDTSWTRLPTELILMVISRLYNIEIVILHETGYESCINTNKNAQKKIYLGLMGESHYLPLKEVMEDTNTVAPKYTEAKIAFFLWATEMWKLLNEPPKNESYDDVLSKDDLSQENKINTNDFVPIETQDKENESFVQFN
jgi:hypothetical protein